MNYKFCILVLFILMQESLWGQNILSLHFKNGQKSQFLTSSIDSISISKVSINQDMATPETSTLDVSSVLSYGVTVNNFVYSSKGSDVMYRGVCWSTTPTPSIQDSIMMEGV